MMDDFDSWEFDTMAYFKLLQDKTIIHFGFKLFCYYGLLDKFMIPDNNFVSLLNSIQNSFYDNTAYHNSMRAIEVTRNFYFFIKKGNLMKNLSDLNLMAGLMAALCHDVGHP